MSVFSERLKELRLKSGAKQTELAQHLGIKPRTMRFYESGEHEPAIDTINKLADFFGVTTDYLMGRTNYWLDAEGNIKVGTPPDILNLDIGQGE